MSTNNNRAGSESTNRMCFRPDKDFDVQTKRVASDQTEGVMRLNLRLLGRLFVGVGSNYYYDSY